MTKSREAILVTGATGRQGGAVARKLLSDGYPVRILTRNANSSASTKLRKLGAEVFTGDLTEPSSLSLACKNAYGVFSVQDFWAAGFQGEIEQGLNIIEAADRAEVQHFIYSSVGGTDRTSHLNIPHFNSKRIIEQKLIESTLAYTIFRPVTFYENFITPRYLKAIPKQGLLRFSINPDKQFQMVAIDDLAAFVAKAFTEPGNYQRKSMEIASDEFTFVEFAQTLTDHLQRPVRYQRLNRVLEYCITSYISLTNSSAYYKAGKELLPMFDWLNGERGWDADIPHLKKQLPLTSLHQWVKSIQWH